MSVVHYKNSCLFFFAAPADYTVINNNITFSTAVTEVHHSTSVVDDPYLEYDEQFFVRLQLLSVSIQDVNLSNNLSIGIMDNDGTM